MNKIDEVIKIGSCPECHKTHSYKLEVTRCLIMGMMTENELLEKPSEKKLTRTFNCPNTQKDFEASFTLTETSMDRVEEVKVSGIVS
ncbi:MAG TPA: hypothetical protein VMW81_10150 [Nitrospinota bacterium]|nr:hypothetical protein [Nitrospinota bacterium]